MTDPTEPVAGASTTTAIETRPAPGTPHGVAQARSLFDRQILGQAVEEVAPRAGHRAPVTPLVDHDHPVALGQLRSLVIGLSMVTAFIELPGGTQLVTTLFHGDPLLIVLTLLWLLIVLTVPLSSWDRRPAAPAGSTAPAVAPA